MPEPSIVLLMLYFIPKTRSSTLNLNALIQKLNEKCSLKTLNKLSHFLKSLKYK